MPKKVLPDFPVTISLPVQWGDQDGFGHVNNMHFIRWFESARIAYLLKCEIEMNSECIGPILASVSCNFRKQVKFPDTVTVGARVTRIGHSSVRIAHQLWSGQNQAVAADGDSTVVMFDYQNQCSIEIPQELRKKIEALENKSYS